MSQFFACYAKEAENPSREAKETYVKFADQGRKIREIERNRISYGKGISNSNAGPISRQSQVIFTAETSFFRIRFMLRRHW